MDHITQSLAILIVLNLGMLLYSVYLHGRIERLEQRLRNAAAPQS